MPEVETPRIKHHIDDSAYILKRLRSPKWFYIMYDGVHLKTKFDQTSYSTSDVRFRLKDTYCSGHGGPSTLKCCKQIRRKLLVLSAYADVSWSMDPECSDTFIILAKVSGEKNLSSGSNSDIQIERILVPNHL